MQCRSLTLICVFLVASGLCVLAQQVRGDYIETRSADVYTGQCFANGEVNLVGDEAILAWHVQSGSWEGVVLDGLTVAAAVKARATLGDPYADPFPTKAVLLVDDEASPQQSEALVAFARQMAGPLLGDVEQMISVPMELAKSPEHHGTALLRAGRLAMIETRPIDSGDHLCGNEVTFYPPLTEVTHSMPAVATTDLYRGPGLGVDWESHGKRSAFVGTFER
jgi:hypothetical protein